MLRGITANRTFLYYTKPLVRNYRAKSNNPFAKEIRDKLYQCDQVDLSKYNPNFSIDQKNFLESLPKHKVNSPI